MKTMSAWILVAVSAVSTGILSGCAGDAATEETASGEEAISRAAIGKDAVAVEIHTVPMGNRGVAERKITIALPTKFNRILRAIKKRGNEPIPRCHPSHRNDLRFLDAQGQEVSKGTYSCSGYGNIYVGDEILKVKINDDTIEALLAEPLTVGDALWGITAVEVTNLPFQKTETIVHPDSVSELVDAVEPEQKLVPADPSTPADRCAPTYKVTFKRNTTDAAVASFICGNPTESEIGASFRIPVGGAASAQDSVAGGRVKLDPRPFAALVPAEGPPEATE